MTQALPQRCPWCGTDPLYTAYHDTEWGVAEYDPRALWEKLVLDGFQAGLAWITILRKRDHFRSAFAGFAPETVASFTDLDVARLLADAGIVRHRGKIDGAITGARAWLKIEASGGFTPFLWRFVDGSPQINSPASPADIPTQTVASAAMSKALKAAGFSFCGPTITYAFMQATGMVNDHLTTCHRHPALAARTPA